MKNVRFGASQTVPGSGTVIDRAGATLAGGLPVTIRDRGCHLPLEHPTVSRYSEPKLRRVEAVGRRRRSRPPLGVYPPGVDERAARIGVVGTQAVAP